MPDTLRDRIAAVVSANAHPLYCDKCPPREPTPQDYEVADAVIAALGLEIERGGTYKVVFDVIHRYVTEWISEGNDNG